MGYSTDFEGSFFLDRKLDQETFELINGLATTRRMKRKGLSKKFGVDGEFFYDKTSKDSGQEHTPDIVDYNRPPSTQPSLWLQWHVEDDMQTISWDGGEKFYCYVEWIQYLIEKILNPKGYVLNGTVKWLGEDPADSGKIRIKNNIVNVL